MLSLPGGAAELRLWSAERPHLYLLLLSLVTARVDGGAGQEGRVLEWEACQVCGSSQFWRCLTACGLVLSSAQVYLVPWAPAAPALAVLQLPVLLLSTLLLLTPLWLLPCPLARSGSAMQRSQGISCCTTASL